MKLVLIILFLSFINNAYSSDCVKRVQVTTQHQSIYLGEPFSAKIILWDKNCFNINDIEKNISIKSNDLYIHKIIKISLSKNNSDVMEIDLTAIHLDLLKNKSLGFSINNVEVHSDKIKYMINNSKVYKKINLFEINLAKEKNLYISFAFVILILLIILLIIYLRKKNKYKIEKVDLSKLINNSLTIEDLIKLADYKKEINSKYSNTYQFFNYLNDVQYKKKISSEELATLTNFKSLFLSNKEKK